MKKLSMILIAILVIVFGSAFALVMFVNPNQFKPLLVEKVKQQTGLDLNIEGDISWQFFPAIGLELGKTELKNPTGYSSVNLLKVQHVDIDVSLFALLEHKLQIGNVRVEGAEVHLETLANGQSNIDALKKKPNDTKQPQSTVSSSNTTPQSSVTQPAETTTENSQRWQVSLEGVDIVNAVLDIQNQQTNTYTKLYEVQLSLTEFAVDEWTSMTFGFKGQHNNQQFALSGTSQIKLADDPIRSQLKDLSIKASYSSGDTQIDSAQLDIAAFQLGKANTIEYQANGTSGTNTFDLKGKTSVIVNKDFNKIGVDAFGVDANLSGDGLPQSPLKVSFEANMAYDLDNQTIKLLLTKAALNDAVLTGNMTAELTDIPKVRFELASDKIDADVFLAQKNDKSGEKAKPNAKGEAPSASGSQKPAPTAEKEPDLSVLQNLDIAGQIKIGHLILQHAQMSNVAMKLAINRGQVSINPFSTELYQGNMTTKITLDVRQAPAQYHLIGTIKDVKALPLLKDVADKDILEGTANATFDLSGSGLASTAIQKNLVGKARTEFTDGAINGINIPQLIRTTYARIKGEKVTETESKKTDFSALTATLALSGGKVKTDDLSMMSPLLRIHGSGNADYINRDIDMLVRTSIVGSLEGQGGKSIDALRDVTIPVKITGSWEKPKYKLIFDDVMKKKAEKELDRGLKKLDDKIKDEKTKKAVNNLLKGLFN
ncbi:AsmA family protein [Vibrio nitrifigilis]|uniref:AsmA family protein n=1 Tax=Vibrio nitrifigilis TaxID=2789781 RepID=A0ABS0GBX3_9VIBR|nr:AsmA family protein [Vibrio nitrifigilis]MBF8999860.1 AsmA family protein [Vibrio nitrifigilis]